jgi:putative phage-type endonuclease
MSLDVAPEIRELLTIDSSDPRWLEFRRTGLGGSDVAVLAGVSPWATPFDLWVEKRGGVVEQKSSPSMSWGAKLEEPIIQAYEEETGYRVLRNSTTYRSLDYDWAFHTVDGFNLTIKDRIVEAKTANGRFANQWGEPGTDQIPAYYNVQTQWYMGLAGYKSCDVAVLIGGSDFRIYTIEFNERLFKTLVEFGEKFWLDHIIADVAPTPVAGSNRVDEYVKSIHVTEPIREATIEEYEWMVTLAKRKLIAKGLNEEIEELENKLKLSIGEAEGVEYNGYRATNKPQTRKTTAWKGVAESFQRLVSPTEWQKEVGENTKPTTFKKFLFTNPIDPDE